MMKICRNAAAVLLACTGWAGQVSAQELCPALERIVAASRETPPFVSLARVQYTEVLVPGYYEGACQIRRAEGVFCYRNVAPAELELGAMSAAIRACLDARPAERTGNAADRTAVFVGHGLRFEVRNSCDHRCRAGLLASFNVTFERAARPE
jgi:hypothetical protein